MALLLTNLALVGVPPSATPRVLSPRLQVLHDLVPYDSVVADVGCDHGFLAIGLVQSGRARQVIACDISQLGLCGAQANVRRYAPAHACQIETRLSDGLQQLATGEAEVLTMSGLAHKKLRAIIEHGRPASRAIRTLVLQPLEPRLQHLADLRLSLWREGYAVTQEVCSRCASRTYMTLRAELGASPAAPDEHELLFGVDRDAHDSTFSDFLSEQRALLAREAQGMELGLTSASAWEQRDEATEAARAALLRRHTLWLELLHERS